MCKSIIDPELSTTIAVQELATNVKNYERTVKEAKKLRKDFNKVFAELRSLPNTCQGATPTLSCVARLCTTRA